MLPNRYVIGVEGDVSFPSRTVPIVVLHRQLEAHSFVLTKRTRYPKIPNFHYPSVFDLAILPRSLKVSPLEKIVRSVFC
jgi:hypothetical protein